MQLPKKFLTFWGIMNSYDFCKLAGVISYLRATKELAGNEGDGEVWPKHIKEHHRPHVEEVRRQCELIELKGSVHRCDLFLRALKPSPHLASCNCRLQLPRSLMQLGGFGRTIHERKPFRNTRCIDELTTQL